MASSSRQEARGGFWNPCDTERQRNLAFAGLGLTSNLVGATSTILDREAKELFPIIFCLSRGEARLKGCPDIPAATLAIAIANAIAPGQDHLPPDQADDRVKEQLLCFLQEEVSQGRNELVTINDANWKTEREATGLLAGIAWLPEARAGLKGIAIPKGVPAAEIWNVLRIFGRYPSEYLARVGALMYATFYIAVSKQGNVHARKLEKLRNDLNTSIGHEVDLNQSQIRLVYEQVASRIKADRIGDAIMEMERQMTGVNIRMAVTLQQAAGSGITGLKLIRRAMTEHPTFDWAKLAAMYASESRNLVRAIKAVGEDKYYGFRRDLGVAKATYYPSYVWTCVALLKKVGGGDNITLNNFAGGPRGIKGQEAVQAMIDAYEPPEAANEATPDSTLVQTEIMGAFEAAKGIE
nr:ORF3 [Chuviridae sp.]